MFGYICKNSHILLTFKLKKFLYSEELIIS